jgi:hypothetical protein
MMYGAYAMSAATPVQERRSSTPEPFSSFPIKSWRVRAGFAALGLVLAAALALAAAVRHPDAEPPIGTELEQRIAGVFGVPDNADDRVIGDLLVERFYAIDVDSGERYVGDLLKGRIQSVQPSTYNGAIEYTLLLDLQGLFTERAVYGAFMEEVARPVGPDVGDYLGLRVPGGVIDAFKLNYSGLLPTRRPAFRSDGQDLQEFLASQRLSAETASPDLITVQGYNYLVSNTEAFPYFREQFATGRAVFVAELIIIDTTSPAAEGLLNRLRENNPPVP